MEFLDASGTRYQLVEQGTASPALQGGVHHAAVDKPSAAIYSLWGQGILGDNQAYGANDNKRTPVESAGKLPVEVPWMQGR